MSGPDGERAVGAKQLPISTAVALPAQHKFSRTDQLLISAARDGDVSLVQELLACTHTININARDRKSGSTALIVASAWGHPKIVSLLLDRGADSTLHNYEGRSALELSSGRDTTLLLLRGLQRSLSPALLLQQATWQGNLPLVQQVLTNGGSNLSLELCNGEGLTPLMLTVRDIKVFQELFQQKLLPCYDPVAIVEFLLNSNADVNHKDSQGRSALHYSVMTPSDTSLKLTQLLLGFGANPNSLDKHSFSPLHFASKAKALDALKVLLAAGADVNKRTYAGHTALHIAASHGDVELASCLLQSGANVTAVTHSGLSPLKCSANREMYLLLMAALESSSIDRTTSGGLHPKEGSGSLKSLDKQHSEGTDESSKPSRKSRSNRRHKTSTNSKKQQVLFTMRVGLAMTNGSTNGSGQIKPGLGNEDASSPQLSSKPLSAPAKFTNLPSRIPVVAKLGSGDLRVQRMVTRLRTKPCSSCDGLSYKVRGDEPKDSEEIHTDSSSDGKHVPDVLKTGANLPLCSKSARRYRRYVPSFVPLNQERYKESEYINNKEPMKESGHKGEQQDQVQGLFVILDPMKSSSKAYKRNVKTSHYMPAEDQEEAVITKPSVHFCVEAKQGGRQRHLHPAMGIKSPCKKNRPKPAKSDSEIETKSLLPVKGQSVSLVPAHNRRGASRLPRKSRDELNVPEHDQFYNPLCFRNPNDYKMGTSLGSVVNQMAAVSLQRTSAESSSGLDTSISSDCVSQVSAASWIYIPEDQLTQNNPTSLPTSQSLLCHGVDISDRGETHWSADSTGNRYQNDLNRDSPEHLYDCPLTPPPSIDYAQKNHILKESSDNQDSDTDAYQWSSDSCATPVGTLLAKATPESACQLLAASENPEVSLARYQMLAANKPKFQWTKGKLLGKGAFGMVWCAMTWTGDLIAVKQVKLSVKNPHQATEEYLQIQQEFQMLQRLQHKNIVSYLGTELDGTMMNIFMQYIAGGSLSQNLSQFGSFAESIIMRYSRQILEGVAYLHGSGIVHRDIKGANIMVMPSELGGLIKLIDFGCAKWLHMSLQDSDHYIQSVRGTPYWMAPEVIQQAGCTEKSDIWSVGCVVIEMASTKPPWHELPPFSAAYAIGQGTSRPKVPPGLSPNAKDFIHSTMHRDPDLRPMAKDLLQHVFLNQMDVSLAQ